MKITTTLFAFAAGTMISSAYTLTVTNQGAFGDPDLPIVDNAGAPLSSGSISVGFFGDDGDISGNAMDFAALITSFTVYGTESALAAGAAPGLTDMVTPANWSVAVPSDSVADQIGKNVYVIFGNAGTIGGSNQLAIWKSDSVFGTEDDAGNGGTAVSLETGKGSLLLGRDTGATLIAGAVTFSNTIGLVTADAVPEPSTSLLAALAGLALAVRRRR